MNFEEKLTFVKKYYPDESLTPQQAAWRRAVEGLDVKSRREIISEMIASVIWSMWLTHVLGWTREEALEWIDDNFSLDLLRAGIPNWDRFDSGMSFIIPTLVGREIHQHIPNSLEEHFFGEVEMALRSFTRRSVFDQDYPWDEVPNVIKNVTNYWKHHNYQPPREHLARNFAAKLKAYDEVTDE